MEKEQRKDLLMICIGAVLLAVVYFLPLTGWWKLLAFLVPYLWLGWEVLKESAENIVHGDFFDEDFLMAVATIGALCIGEYPEAVFVMLFFRVGELFEEVAEGKSRRSISDLMDIRPDYANIERNGALVKVSPEEVAIGDSIVVKPGEKVPLDGIVTEGVSALNTMALTGESLPRDVQTGDRVFSGCINNSGLLTIKVTHSFGESTAAKILALVEDSSSRKAKTERFITRFSRIYTPAVVGGAVLLAVIPSLIDGNWSQWIYRALLFLVVSCPCALVISVPLSFFGGIGGASKKGILIKGANYLEVLAKTDTVVFDKTGTLTQGNFLVTAVHPQEMSPEQLLEIAALAESYSDHPISMSLKNAYHKDIDRSRVEKAEEIAGHGIKVRVDGKEVYVGNDKLMDSIGVAWKPCHHQGTIVHVTVEGVYAGHIVIADEIKPDAALAVHALREQGVRRLVMLTGDRKAVGEEVAATLKLDEVHAELMPADKVSCVDALLKKKNTKVSLAFVGDGINDAPVLSRADVGIAMGALGSDAAIEAADVVLMDDKPSKIADAIRISRRTKRIATENIVFALAVKLAVLVLGACGVAGMGAAVFADVGVTVIAVINASRALRS